MTDEARTSRHQHRQPRNRRSRVRIAAAGVVATLALLVAPLPANANTWHVSSSRSYCYVVSGWQDCRTETTWFRQHSSYCQNRPLPVWPSYLSWYLYCYKTTTTYR